MTGGSSAAVTTTTGATSRQVMQRGRGSGSCLGLTSEHIAFCWPFPDWLSGYNGNKDKSIWNERLRSNHLHKTRVSILILKTSGQSCTDWICCSTDTPSERLLAWKMRGCMRILSLHHSSNSQELVLLFIQLEMPWASCTSRQIVSFIRMDLCMRFTK